MVGYSFGGPRVEFEYNYRNNGANTIATQGGTQSATGDLTANSYMLNVLYDFDTGSKWVPYIGLGLGMADVKANNIHSAQYQRDGSYLNGGSNKFAAQFIFGAEYQINEKFGVTIDWRGLWASNATFNYGIGCKNGGTGACGQTGAIYLRLLERGDQPRDPIQVLASRAVHESTSGARAAPFVFLPLQRACSSVWIGDAGLSQHKANF